MSGQKIGEMKYDNLLGGDFPRETDSVVLASGAVYPVGAVIGKAAATGKCSLVDSGKSDGTETVHGILMRQVDATAADAVGVVSLTGSFNENALTFGGSDNADTHRDAARRLCIFFKKPAL